MFNSLYILSNLFLKKYPTIQCDLTYVLKEHYKKSQWPVFSCVLFF